MWKPGTAKPSNSFTALSTTSKEKKMKKASRPKLDLDISDEGDTKSLSAKTIAPSSATPRKRLSGGTMNMRFMKRRKTPTNGISNDDSEKQTPGSHKKPSPHKMVQNNDAMDIGVNDGISIEKDCEDGSKYVTATSVDMYGIEASLIGRRSFRGFNAPIERIWKDSKGCLENRGVKGNKVTDEELLRRYQDTAIERGRAQGARGVGNLEKKNKSKKRR